MLNPQGRRILMSRPRPRSVLFITLAAFTTYILFFSGPSIRMSYPSPPRLVPDEHATAESQEMMRDWEIDIEEVRKWKDPDDPEDPNLVEPGYETDGKDREPGDIGKLQHEKDMRKLWRYVYKATAE